jgi:hypothetical protein
MTLYQQPNFLGIIVHEIGQTITIKIWIAHINRHQIKPISNPEPKAITQVQVKRARYNQ